MAEQRYRPRRPVELQARASFLGQRIVHLGQLGGEFADVEPAELLAPGKRFRPADLQYRRQDPHQRVGLPDDAAEQFFLLGRVAGLGCGVGS